jgi:hypothetical protein
MLKQILIERLGKMLEFERLIPSVLITIATVALFVGMCEFETWSYAAGTFGGVGVGSLIASKRIGTKDVPA